MRLFGLDIQRAKDFRRKDNAQGTITHQEVGSRSLRVSGVEKYLGVFSPCTYLDNFVAMFNSIAEVQFPILYLCRRIANANFVLKKERDDSIVWASTARTPKDRYVASIVEQQFLRKPNPYMSFRGFVLESFIYKYLTGNSYIYAFTESRNADSLWEKCKSFYVLPSPDVQIKVKDYNFFRVREEEAIEYWFNFGRGNKILDPKLMMHTKDNPSLEVGVENQYYGKSRLLAQKYPISNICAVYEARNVIYVKRGAVGMIVNQNRDVDGSISLRPSEKDKIREEFYNLYGVGEDKTPLAIIDKPVSYVPIGLSIQSLEPFRECLVDAAAIAAAYGIDSNLIPRENNPTYSNLNTAEINVYNSSVIPEVKMWLEQLNEFLGLKKAGYYIDADWSDVAILQEDARRKEASKASISARMKTEFAAGIATLNEWRVAVGKERNEMDIYDKTLLEMNDKEIAYIMNRVKL